MPGPLAAPTDIAGVPRTLVPATAFALALTLVVIGASAYIRFVESGVVNSGALLQEVRVLHRVCATLAAIMVIAAVAGSWRAGDTRLRVLAITALGITLALSAIGIAFGMTPPPAARAGNLLGGLALAAVLATLLGRASAGRAAPQAAGELRVALAFGVVQAVLGAWLAADPESGRNALLLAHVMLGLTTLALAVTVALRLFARHAVLGTAVVAAALLAVIAGSSSALIELPPAAALVHPVTVALLLAALAGAAGRPR